MDFGVTMPGHGKLGTKWHGAYGRKWVSSKPGNLISPLGLALVKS